MDEQTEHDGRHEAAGELINPGNAGIVYDIEGRQLGGGERVAVTGLDDVGQAAVDAGYLLYALGASQPE